LYVPSRVKARRESVEGNNGRGQNAELKLLAPQR